MEIINNKKSISMCVYSSVVICNNQKCLNVKCTHVTVVLHTNEIAYMLAFAHVFYLHVSDLRLWVIFTITVAYCLPFNSDITALYPE